MTQTKQIQKRIELLLKNIKSMTVEQAKAVHEQVKAWSDYLMYHRIEQFEAHPYQDKFFKAGKKYNFRFLLAGNR